MKKINILLRGNKFKWGYNFGYWSLFNFFREELLDRGYSFNFYNKIDPSFFDCDYIFVSNKFFTDNYKFKLFNKFGFLKRFLSNKIRFNEIAEYLSKKNKNLIWFDLTDSAGTTQFEVLPHVKKYVKGQLYKNKELYRKNLFRNRYFSDYYQKKFRIENDIEFNFCKLEANYEHKVILGWNLGVGNFFDIINYSNFEKFICLSKFIFLKDKKRIYNYSLGNRKTYNKKFDLFFRLSNRKNNEKKSIHYQRQYVEDFLNKRYDLDVFKNKMNHRKYLINLMNSKISVGCFGWGEICYREFEATRMGTAFVYPNLQYIETWPNIFLDGKTYKSYELDFSNLQETIEFLLDNKNIRDEMVYNSQEILNGVYSNNGFNYIIKFLAHLN
tara:strand:- start:2789 stop:3940 length:1152 start_codon:yes stop_codon:yes gene_type:complete